MNGKPAVVATHINACKLAGYGDLQKAVKRAGVTEDDVRKHSPYDGDNEHDYLYVPEVLRELEQMGFDGYEGLGVMANYEIPIRVVWDPNKIRFIDPMGTL